MSRGNASSVEKKAISRKTARETLFVLSARKVAIFLRNAPRMQFWENQKRLMF